MTKHWRDINNCQKRTKKTERNLKKNKEKSDFLFASSGFKDWIVQKECFESSN